MKKKFLRIIFILIAVFLFVFSTFTLVGCSGDSSDDDSSGCGCENCSSCGENGCDSGNEPDNSGNVGT